MGGVTVTGFVGEDNVLIEQETGPGADADTPPGPPAVVGDSAVFTYVITNSGTADLTNVILIDSTNGAGTLSTITCGNIQPSDIVPFTNALAVGESVTCTATYEVVIGDLNNTVSNTATVSSTQAQDATDPAHFSVEDTKFFVVDKDADVTFEYSPSGLPVTSNGLATGNNDPRGAAANATSDTLWVVDKDKHVYVYDDAGTPLGNWKAIGVTDKIQGIATDGTSIWIVDDASTEKVLFYNGGASFTASGEEHDKTSEFSLATGNDKPRGITTDGTNIWVVNDAKDGPDKVYKYTLSGGFLGSWTIDPANVKPKGITVNPAGGTTVWIVDQETDEVFQYDAATGIISGNKTKDFVFPLVGGNSKPEGIADPPSRAPFQLRPGTRPLPPRVTAP